MERTDLELEFKSITHFPSEKGKVWSSRSYDFCVAELDEGQCVLISSLGCSGAGLVQKLIVEFLGI